MCVHSLVSIVYKVFVRRFKGFLGIPAILILAFVVYVNTRRCRCMVDA